MAKLNKGFVQIYTGNGKGKSTAAIGLAVRALGCGLKVYMLQLMKDFPYNESNLLAGLNENLVLKKIGKDDWVFRKENPPQSEVQQAALELDRFEEYLAAEKFDLFILDEICAAIYFGLVDENRVIQLIDIKPENIELVLTGRYCSEKLIERADLVTEMKEVKHYYTQGIKSRAGIDH